MMTMTEPSTPPLTIRLLGPFDVRVHGAPLPRLHSRKGQWLLALLVLRHGHEVERSWLSGMLWPDSPEPQAFMSLRNSLKDLRRALAPEAGRIVSPTTHSLSLDVSGLSVDVVAFDAAIARGDGPSLEKAVEVYRGPLLEGCEEEWVYQERQAREQAYLGALEALAVQALAAGDAPTAERYSRRAVVVDPLRESAHRLLMQALAAGGNYAAALIAYRELRELLRREINAEPHPETTSLFRQIRAEARLRAAAPSPASANLFAPARPAAPPPVSDGTVTFLLTDIEGSTRLWEEHPEAMRTALARHHALLVEGIHQHGGTVVQTQGEGDSIFAVFARASDAVAAACTLQRRLQKEPWPVPTTLKVRMALNTGEAELHDGDYHGVAVSRCARLRDAGHGGQILLSRVTQEIVRDRLPEGATLRDLGEYRLKDLTRPERIFQLLHPDLPTDFPPLETLELHRQNLPAQRTPLLGRDRELAALRDCVLQEAAGLVTVSGPGGIGKTRLALAAAADLIDQFPDGVFFVPLASITDPQLVVEATARVAEVTETPGKTLLECLQEFLRDRQLLLLLDNFEHVLPAASAVAELRAACPLVKVLVTSRARLHVYGEQEFPVAPLALPSRAHLPEVEGLSQYPAIALFIQQARKVKPDFSIDRVNAAAVVEICHRLDGLPLAIELAAARIRLFPPELLLTWMANRLQILSGGARDLPTRQQTLRGEIAWSYDLLDESEQRLFRHLSVMVGGFSLEAAQRICNPTGDRAMDVLNGLASLLDNSLLRPEENSGVEPRFSMLETIREFARECLAASGEELELRHRHARFFQELAETAEARLTGTEQVTWLDRMDADYDNLQAALEYCLEQGRAPDRADCETLLMGLRLAGALGRYWQIRGYFTAGRSFLTRLLEQTGGIPVGDPRQGQSGVVPAGDDSPERATFLEARARALYCAGLLAVYQGDYAAARSLCDESLALWRGIGDSKGLAETLGCLAIIAKDQGEQERAEQLFGESLILWRAVGDRVGVASTLGYMGILAADRQDTGAAECFYQESLTLRRQAGDRWGIAASLNNLGVLALHQGNYGVARPLLEESLEIRRQLGDMRCIAVSLNNLGLTAFGEGDRARAVTLFAESLEVAREIGDRRSIAYSLEAFARLAAQEGDAQRAVRLCGAAAALRQTLGAPLSLADRAIHEPVMVAARAALGDAVFAATCAEGQAMTLEEAVVYALQDSQRSA